MTLTTLLIVVLILVLIGGVTPIYGGNFYGTGWRGGGLIGVVLVVLLVLLLLGRI